MMPLVVAAAWCAAAVIVLILFLFDVVGTIRDGLAMRAAPTPPAREVRAVGLDPATNDGPLAVWMADGTVETWPDDRLYRDLKGARERLCRASVSVPAGHRTMLDEAIVSIDRIGAYHCPQWSRFDQPSVREP